MVLNVTIQNRIATYIDDEYVPVCGNDGDKIQFTFDEEWAQHETKTARFKWNGAVFDQEFTGEICEIPKIDNADFITVGVFVGEEKDGERELSTTNTKIPYKRSTRCGKNTPHGDSGESYTNEAKGYAKQAQEAAEATQEMADQTKGYATQAQEATEATQEMADRVGDIVRGARGIFANSLKGKAIGGGAVSVGDISPIAHELNITMESRNLVPHPFVSNNGTARIGDIYSHSGVSYTVNSDYSVTVDGVADSNNSIFYINGSNGAWDIPAGTYTVHSTGDIAVQFSIDIENKVTKESQYLTLSNQSKQLVLTDDSLIKVFRIMVLKGKSVNNITVYPMIEKGSVETKYTPYIDINNINNAPSKNLFNASDYTVTNGILNADNSISANMSNGYFIKAVTTSLNDFILANMGKAITFSVNQTDADKTLSIVINGTRAGGASWQEKNGVAGARFCTMNIATDFTKVSDIELRIGRKAERYEDISTVYRNLQLEFGAIATTYEPYIGANDICSKAWGKNLANILENFDTSGNDLTSTKIVSKSGLYCSCIPVLSGTTYTLSKASNEGGRFRYFFYDRKPIVAETNSIGGAYIDTEMTKKITVPANAAYMVVAWGDKFDNFQVEKGSVATEYEPYVDANTASIKLYGKNLLNPNTRIESKTLNGITIQYLPDEDCYLLNGTATVGRDYYRVTDDNILVNDGIMLTSKVLGGSCNVPEGKFATFYVGAKDTEYGEIINWRSIAINKSSVSSTTSTIRSRLAGHWFFISEGVSFNNLKVQIQIEKGSVATGYEAYKKPVIKNIENGKVKEVYSVYPCTTIISAPEILIDCKYNKDINKAFEELYNAIISLGGNV